MSVNVTHLVVQLLCLVAALVGLPRWLRVAQREHYLPGSSSWVANLWASVDPRTRYVGLLGPALLVVGVLTTPWIYLGAAAVSLVVPIGLPFRGRTSPLHWTSRVRRLAGLIAAIVLVLCLLLPFTAAFAAVALPFIVDLGLAVTRPVEERLSRRFLLQAKEKVATVQPTVVAITGSYGKTSTKNYLAHLLASTRSVLASPASFNNAMGLSKAVNDALLPGTEVFIAEMGTYGPGEIEALCRVFPPDIAVLTAIGEMHLQRMKTRQGVLAAKAEITQGARAVVVNANDDLLRQLADDCARRGQQVIRCSVTDVGADVALVDGHLHVDGEDLGAVELPETAVPGNAAVALGAALALGADLRLLLRQLADLPTVAHRLEAVAQPGGSWILDDTYNSNPAGAAMAVRRAVELAGRSGGRAHVVTPGMVELGEVQAERNEQLARDVAQSGVATLVVVGRTNGAALVEGASGRSTEVVEVADRAAAVALVEQRSVPGDVVLFENDLPDHYP